LIRAHCKEVAASSSLWRT